MNFELILKLPENKLPCICILFEKEYDAQKLNYMFVNNYSDRFYKVTFDIAVDGSLSILFVHSDISGLRYRYENVKYDTEKLKRFIASTIHSEMFNFCHIFNHNDKHHVVKTIIDNRLWVLKLAKMDVNYHSGI